MLLFKRFWPRFLRIERAYATYVKLGSDVTDERTVFYNGRVAHKHAFISAISQISKLSLNQLKRFIEFLTTIVIHYLSF